MNKTAMDSHSEKQRTGTVDAAVHSQSQDLSHSLISDEAAAPSQLSLFVPPIEAYNNGQTTLKQ